MPPSSKSGPSTASSSPSPAKVTSAPATPVSTATATHTKRSAFGELYFQPTREGGESQEDYQKRLETINRKAAKFSAPKSSPGSFTLLTQSNEKGFTGETRFDEELSSLEKKKENLKKEIARYEDLIRRADATDKKIYASLIEKKEVELHDLTVATDTFTLAGGDHYMNAKKNESFAETPRKMKTGNLNKAIEIVQTIKGNEVGKEIRKKNQEEWEEGKKLKQELSELRSKAKELLKGNIPQDVKDDLYNTLTFLEGVLAHDGTSDLNVPADSDTKRMIDNLRRTVDGTALLEKDSVLPKTPGEALAEIASAGDDINTGTLMHYGLTHEDAENLIKLLTEKGILDNNS